MVVYVFTYKHDCSFVAYIVSLPGLGVLVHYIYQRSVVTVVAFFIRSYICCACAVAVFGSACCDWSIMRALAV